MENVEDIGELDIARLNLGSERDRRLLHRRVRSLSA